MKGLVLTYVIMVAGSLGSLKNPIYGMYAYAIFSIVQPQVMFGWAGDLSGISQIVGLAMLGGWALHGFGSWQFGRARSVVFLLLAFFFWVCVSGIQAPNGTVAWATVIERLKIVLAFLVGITMFSSRDQVRFFAWLVVVSQGYVAYEMNAAYFFEGYNRASEEGLFGDNNAMAINMVTSLGPAVFLGFDTKKWWQKGVAFGFAALMLHTVILTFSRGGILSLIATGITIVILMPKRPAYLAVVVLAALLSFRLMGAEVTERFMTTFASEDERDSSAQSRLDLWQDALLVVKTYPIAGLGPRHWPFVAAEFGWPPGKEVHSLWLQTAAELGVPGVSLLLAFYLVAAMKGLALGYRMKGKPEAVYGLYVCSGLIGFVFAAQFVTLEGLELPYFVALVGAGALKVTSLPEAQTAGVAEPTLSYRLAERGVRSA